MLRPVPWNGAERRDAPRHDVVLPVSLDQGSGVTRNVSVSGIAFETTHPLTPGRATRISLPLQHPGDHAIIWLHCEGRVIRAEPAPGGLRVAARLTSHRFAPKSPTS
jgi:hypothetical protein